MEDVKRVGVEINRLPNETWEALVIRYARTRNLVPPCIQMYNSLISSGIEEAYAALQALAQHSCTDIIIDKQHIARDSRIIN